MGAIPNQDFSMTREPTATGNNFLYIKNAPPAVTDLVQTFYNLQKKLAKTCLYVAHELKNLNINEPNPRFNGIDELKKRLQIILESNQDAYEAQQGTNNTLLDLKLGNIYPGKESLQAMQMNTMIPVQGGQDQGSPPLLIGLGEYKNILNIDMGAERFVRVFKEASSKLINPDDGLTPMPLKQMKLLHSMLHQVNLGGTNIYITKILDAMSDAIHIKSADGEQKLLPDVLVTNRGNSHNLTKTLTHDGVQYTVYDSFQVVAPNFVMYEGKPMQHVCDWVQVIFEMTETKCWSTSEKSQTSSTGEAGSQQNNPTVVHNNVEMSEPNGEPKVCEKYRMVVDLITGDDSKPRRWAIRRLSQLRPQQRRTLTELTGLKFIKAENGKYYYDKSNSHSLSKDDAISSNLSAQTIAAYWLATKSYPKSISRKMKNKCRGKSTKTDKSTKTNTTRRKSSPSSTSTDGTGNADPSRRSRNKESTSSSSPTKLQPFILNGQKYVRIGGELLTVPPDHDDNQPPDKSRDDENPSKRRHNQCAFGKGGRPGASPSPSQQSHRKARARGGSSKGRRH